MNKSLQGRFREVIHNNYTLYYFVYMYTQICDENALICSWTCELVSLLNIKKKKGKISDLMDFDGDFLVAQRVKITEYFIYKSFQI